MLSQAKVHALADLCALVVNTLRTIVAQEDPETVDAELKRAPERFLASIDEEEWGADLAATRQVLENIRTLQRKYPSSPNDPFFNANPKIKDMLFNLKGVEKGLAAVLGSKDDQLDISLLLDHMVEDYPPPELMDGAVATLSSALDPGDSADPDFGGDDTTTPTKVSDR